MILEIERRRMGWRKVGVSVGGSWVHVGEGRATVHFYRCLGEGGGRRHGRRCSIAILLGIKMLLLSLALEQLVLLDLGRRLAEVIWGIWVRVGRMLLGGRWSLIHDRAGPSATCSRVD